MDICGVCITGCDSQRWLLLAVQNLKPLRKANVALIYKVPSSYLHLISDSSFGTSGGVCGAV
jgi:hypothetical protein